MSKQFFSDIMNGHMTKVCRAVEKDIAIANMHFIHLASGITALSTACKFRRLNIAEYLLSKDANINKPDNQGKTALFYAVAHFDAQAGCADLLKMLLSRGADDTLSFDIPIPEKPSKDYFCFNCTGVADDGTNEPSRDLTNPAKLVVYRQKKLTVLEIAQVFNLTEAVVVLQEHALKKLNVSSEAVIEERSPSLQM
jgi:ankyrin repeat protein